MARILGPFGVKGWVKVKTFTEEAAAIGEFPQWLVQVADEWRPMRVEEFEVHAKGPVARLEGCDDREAAFKLTGCEVAVTRGDLGEAEEGSIFWVDLVGLDVVDESGAPLGKVEGLFESGETSVLVLGAAPPGTGSNTRRMIPFVGDYVKSVDRDARRITVDWKPEYDA
jgi:16S rRNA processing protein RimM